MWLSIQEFELAACSVSPAAAAVIRLVNRRASEPQHPTQATRPAITGRLTRPDNEQRHRAAAETGSRQQHTEQAAAQQAAARNSGEIKPWDVRC